MKNLHDLISEKIRLPSPPAIAIKILDMVRKDDFSFRDLARIIESDPALVAKILRVANSPYYNLARKVTTIETALSILGTHAVKNIALSFVICSDLKAKEDIGFDFDLFWRRAMTAAVAADLAAALVGLNSRDIFVTALLQDIGIIYLHASSPEDYHMVISEKYTTREPLHVVEERFLGFDHQELGAELLSRWQLPEEIHVPIRHHHLKDSIPEQYRKHTEILQLSDYLSSVYHGSESVTKVRMVKNIFESAFGIHGDAVDKLIDDVARKTLEIAASFDIPPGSMRPFSQIMQEANEELSNLNTSYELLVIELRQSKEKAEKLAYELNSANKKLHELAFRDALTGLYNHRFFQESLDNELDSSIHSNREFSFIIFDIDHFKKVNDTYGHPIGDRVLMAIGKAAGQSVRSTDILARYGGEEFAIILPKTCFAEATAVANAVRSSIEQLNVDVDGTTIKVTVSAGYTTYRPGANIQGKGAIISMADKALYIAKQSGRNRVHAMKFPGT